MILSTSLQVLWTFRLDFKFLLRSAISDLAATLITAACFMSFIQPQYMD